MSHGAAANGGGAYVNQYTLIYDIYVPFGAWRSLLQTGANTSDGDLFINPSGAVGISGTYEGNVTEATWHRLALAIDLSGPGQAPVLTKFIDGVKVGNQTGGLSARDGRFALDVSALLFADNDGDIGCINDPRAMTYTANMQVTGVGGLLNFVLQASDPAPPIKGTNSWTVKVLDAKTGMPVSAANLMVMPFMPDHGHGTSIVPTVTAQPDDYKIDNVYLFMAGLWRVTIQVTTTDGHNNDAANFLFCIQG